MERFPDTVAKSVLDGRLPLPQATAFGAVSGQNDTIIQRLATVAGDGDVRHYNIQLCRL